jgi:hypothetical protein
VVVEVEKIQTFLLLLLAGVVEGAQKVVEEQQARAAVQASRYVANNLHYMGNK